MGSTGQISFVLVPEVKSTSNYIVGAALIKKREGQVRAGTLSLSHLKSLQSNFCDARLEALFRVRSATHHESESSTVRMEDWKVCVS